MSILSFKNSLLDSNISVRDLPYWDWEAGIEISGRRDRGIMTDADISRLVESPTYYYMTNQLVLSLRPAPEEVEMHLFKTDIGDAPGDRGFTTFWRTGTPAPVREWDNWTVARLGNSPGGLVNQVRYVSVSNTQIVIEITRDAVQRVRHRDPLFYPDPLEFGILVLPIEFVNPDGEEYTKYYGIKVTTNEIFSPVTEESREIEVPRDNDYTTPVYSFENLFIPTLSCSLVYNFYESNEGNYDIISRRDYSGFKLRDIPKYNYITWGPAPLWTPPLSAVTGATATEIPPAGADTGEGPFITPPASIDDPSLVSDATRPTVSIGGFVFTLDGEDGGVFGGSRTAEDSDRVFSEESIEAIGAVAGRAGLGLFGSEESEDTGLVDFELEEDIIGSGLDITEDGLRDRPDRTITEIPVPEFVMPILKTGYMGYVIQKERWDDAEQVFRPVDIILINGRRNNRWVDWKIAYNEVYRYKIRSVFRFVNRDGLTMYADSDEIIDTSTEFAKFDENSIGSFEQYYYDSKFSNPCSVEVLEFRQPDPPDNIKIFPNSKKREIFISWNQKNPNRDVIGFNLYKKEIGERFFKRQNVELIDTRNNFWIDYSVELGKEYLYAVEAVDVHYNFSNLSAQYSAQITEQDIDIPERCEVPAKFIYGKGRRFGAGDPVFSSMRKDNLAFFDDKFKIKINPLFRNLERSDPFLLKIRSLDTYIEKEIEINFKVNTIYHRIPSTVEERVRNVGGIDSIVSGRESTPVGPTLEPLFR